MNDLMQKIMSRQFLKLENVVLDIVTGGKIGVRDKNGIASLQSTVQEDGSTEHVISINPIDEFGYNVPAFALATPIENVQEGDLIVFKNNNIGGWVTSKTAAALEVLKADGTISRYSPQNVQLFGTGNRSVMVVKSLFGMFGGNTEQVGSFQNMLLPLLLAKGGDGADLDILPLMLMMQGGGAAGGMNPMMLMMLMGDKKGGGSNPLSGLMDDPLMAMMMFGGMGGGVAAGGMNPLMMAMLLKK